jgi:hypothetical protein
MRNETMQRMLRTSDGVVVVITFLAPQEYEKARDAEIRITQRLSHHPMARHIDTETTGGRIDQWNLDPQ